MANISKQISLMAKKSKGRQKIEMTKMSKESNLLVTFSKRRSGLFKKASELCTLCGVEIAIVVFSPGKKAFSFGHPSVEAIADKFFHKTSMHGSSGATSQLVEAHRSACVRELNVHLTEAMNELEVERKKGEELNKLRKKPIQERCWWESPVEELGMEQLQQLKMAMEELKKNMVKQAEKLHMIDPSNSQYPNSSGATSFYAAGPSTLGNVKASGLGVPMKPHGHGHGHGHGHRYGIDYRYGDGLGFGQGHEHGYFR